MDCRNNILLFLLIFGLLQFSLMGLSSIFRATLTFVEKQFNIDSKTSGLITSGNEMASLLLILPVTYLGSRVHRPLCIAIGAIIVAIAYACLGLPHFFLDDWDINRMKNNTGGDVHLCNINNNSNKDEINSNISQNSDHFGSSPLNSDKSWVLLLLAQLLVGVGGTHIYSYGASYVDDFADKTKSPLYFGILMSLNLLGPGFGHMVGAFTSNIFVDIDRGDIPVGISHKDPRWVGAWWLGPILMSIVVTVISIFLFIFPKSMLREKDGDHRRILRSSTSRSTTHSFSIQEDTKKQLVQMKFWDFARAFPIVTWRLLTNPVFSLCCLCFGLVMALVAAIAVFQPKYMQEEFMLSSSTANFLIGAIKMPLGIVGTLSGGALMSRLKLDRSGATKMVAVLALLSLFTLIPNLFIGCPTRQVAGVNVQLNQCSYSCSCDQSVFDPVCGADGIQYPSPCLAGCVSVSANSSDTLDAAKNYNDCLCLQSNKTLGAESGGCHNEDCLTNVYIYTGLGAFQMLVSGLLQAPTIMILLRSIAVEDKSFGLGIMMLCGRLIGWLPTPALTGALIDSTCIAWEGSAKWLGKVSDPVESPQPKGACLLYDSELLKNRYWGMLIGLDAAILLIFVLIAIYVNRREPKNEEDK